MRGWIQHAMLSKLPSLVSPPARRQAEVITLINLTKICRIVGLRYHTWTYPVTLEASSE